MQAIHPEPHLLKALAISIAILCAPTSVEAQTQAEQLSIPMALLGEFVDDYGIQYVVTEGQWLQGENTRYEIVEWNVEGRFLVARNGAGNQADAGLWTRIDWITLEPGTEFTWAFCYTTYDARSKVEAEATASSDRG